MRVAEILSDLTSLRVCDHNDALALVNVNKRLSPESTEDKGAPTTRENQNLHLQCAKELVDLHSKIKAKHVNGSVDEELSQARNEVNQVLRELDVVKYYP